MYKYLCAIILGILIYILLNQYNSFSVGGQGEGASCSRPAYVENEENDFVVPLLEDLTVFYGGCDPRLVCKRNPDVLFDEHGAFIGGTCEERQDTKRWDDLNMEQQSILWGLGWNQASWNSPEEEFEPHVQFEKILSPEQINELRGMGMPDEFLNKFWIRGNPGSPCRRRRRRNPLTPEVPRCNVGECLEDDSCPIADPAAPAPALAPADAGSRGNDCRRFRYVENEEDRNNCDPGLICTSNQDTQFIGTSFSGTCQPRQDTKGWDDLNAEQQGILNRLNWDEASWSPNQSDDILQFKKLLSLQEIKELRVMGMSDEFLNKFWIRGNPGAPCLLRAGLPQCRDRRECLENDHCPIRSAAGGGGGGGGGAAGAAGGYGRRGDPRAAGRIGGGRAQPICNPGDPCAGGRRRAGGHRRRRRRRRRDAAAAAGDPLPVIPEVDPSVSPINLDNIHEDREPQEHEFETDCHDHIPPELRVKLDRLKLKYVSEGEEVSLNFVSYLSKGGFGYVCRYASHARDERDTVDNYIAIAVKFLIDDRGEVQVVEAINANIELKDCNMTTAEVLYYRGNLEVVILMELMDDNCSQRPISQDENYWEINGSPSFPKIYSFFTSIVIDLKCISEIGYVYTDLKLANCLYKVQSDDRISIKLGDLDSIKPKRSRRVISTYFTIRHLILAQAAEFTDIDVFWGIGCMAVEAYIILERTRSHVPARSQALQSLKNFIGMQYMDIVAERAVLARPPERRDIIRAYYTRITDVLNILSDYIPQKLYRLFTITLCSESIRGGTTYDEILDIVRTT